MLGRLRRDALRAAGGGVRRRLGGRAQVDGRRAAQPRPGGARSAGEGCEASVAGRLCRRGPMALRRAGLPGGRRAGLRGDTSELFHTALPDSSAAVCRQRLTTAAAAAVALPALDGIFFLTTRANASCSLSCLAQGLGQVVHPGVQVVHVPSCMCLYAVYQYPVPGMLVGTGRACLNQSSELHLYFCYTYNVHHAKSGRLWILPRARNPSPGRAHTRCRAPPSSSRSPLGRRTAMLMRMASPTARTSCPSSAVVSHKPTCRRFQPGWARTRPTRRRPLEPL